MRRKTVKLRRKILTKDGYKFITLYKMFGKLGTYSTTIFYFFEKPVEGKIINCIHDIGNYSVNDNNLMHQPVESVLIDKIRESDNFIFAQRM